MASTTQTTLFESVQTLILSNPDLCFQAKSCGVTMQSRLREDLGLDSILMIALLCELQMTHPFVDESHLSSWQTIADMIATLERGSA